DERALALGAAVAQVIGGVDGRAVADEMIGDVRVARRVLTVAVRDHGDVARTRAWPLVHDDAPPAPGDPRLSRLCHPATSLRRAPRGQATRAGDGLPGTGRGGMVGSMSLLRFLGLGHPAPVAGAGAETETVRRVVAALERMDPGTARYVARFAYVLGRVAAA